MSAMSRLRQKWHYETNIPRCESCQQYRAAQMYLVDSLPRTSKPLCALGGFDVRPNAVCDKWQGKTGETLEKVAA